MPAASSPDLGPPLPHTWRPLGVRLALIFFGGLLVVVCVAGWVAVGPVVRAKVTVYQQVTVLLLALLGGVVAWGLLRCRITATERGIEVVNGYRRHALEWAEVLAIHLPNGAPWATLDLADGTSIFALGIQSADGDRARYAVRQLRALLNRITEESLQRPDPPRD